jgi:hypothetical protein
MHIELGDKWNRAHIELVLMGVLVVFAQPGRVWFDDLCLQRILFEGAP